MEKLKAAGIKVLRFVLGGNQKRMGKNRSRCCNPEGMEGGGHIGSITTMALVPQVVASVKIPVIAAGDSLEGNNS